ncbi:MAG TPA: MerR family transcriptional regulator [Spirochaetota bacterium]|nr:MerR family transcriptional regulator [Spirochaetota bacterium]
MNDETLSIRQIAESSNLSAYTLRYYESIGLIPWVKRHPGSTHRIYNQFHIEWIEYLKAFRSSGMSIKDLREYVRLMESGDSTIKGRIRILEAHRAKIKKEMDEIINNLKLIEHKITHYRSIERKMSSLRKDI